MDKYQTALMLIRPVIESTNGRAVTRAWDDLFMFIHAEFTAPLTEKPKGSTISSVLKEAGARDEYKAEIEECRTMLHHNHNELVEHLRARPPEYSDKVFPIAIARYLLRDCNVSLNAMLSKSFDEFHRRYGAMVLGSIYESC